MLGIFFVLFFMRWKITWLNWKEEIKSRVVFMFMKIHNFMHIRTWLELLVYLLPTKQSKSLFSFLVFKLPLSQFKYLKTRIKSFIFSKAAIKLQNLTPSLVCQDKDIIDIFMYYSGFSITFIQDEFPLHGK